MENISIINDSEFKKWDHFVLEHSGGNIYQTSAWKEVIRKSFGHQPLYFTLRNTGGEITAVMPFFAIKSRAFGNRLTSLPCAQVCNPLVIQSETYELLLQHVFQYLKKQHIPYAELKTTISILRETAPVGDPFTGYSTYTLDLGGEINAIEQSLHKDCIRRAIKKANQFGLKLVIGNSRKDVKIFYDLYLKMRKAYGLLPQPYRFFSAMWETLFPQNMIKVLHAEHEGEIVSSLVLLQFKDTVIYEYGASCLDRLHLKASPFLLWEAIKETKNRGFKTFDFGRTENDNEGLSTFKKRWNTKQEVLQYYYLPDITGFSAMRQKGLARQLMYHTIQHSPAAVCRCMGRMLYKIFV